MMPFLDVILGAVISSTLSFSIAVAAISGKNTERMRLLELQIAALQLESQVKFITKEDFNKVSDRIASHMEKIESKLDAVIFNGNPPKA